MLKGLTTGAPFELLVLFGYVRELSPRQPVLMNELTIAGTRQMGLRQPVRDIEKLLNR